ncbi:hypothetical protein ACKWTF_004801 [Chironomus riparius]
MRSDLQQRAKIKLLKFLFMQLLFREINNAVSVLAFHKQMLFEQAICKKRISTSLHVSKKKIIILITSIKHFCEDKKCLMQISLLQMIQEHLYKCISTFLSRLC